MFMNEDKKLFENLTGDEMKIVADNLNNAEVYCPNKEVWNINHFYQINPFLIYRIPNQLDHFDWSVVDPKWKNLRRDKNGNVYLYQADPFLGDSHWTAMDDWESIEITGVFSCYKNNGMPWNEMILDRPEGV